MRSLMNAIDNVNFSMRDDVVKFCDIRHQEELENAPGTQEPALHHPLEGTI